MAVQHEGDAAGVERGFGEVAPPRAWLLARLLDLNRARAEEERLLGLSPRGGAMEEEEATEDAEDLI